MTDATQNGSVRRLQMTVSLGSILTIISGVFIAAVMLVTVTRAFDDLDKKISLLQRDVRSIERTLHLPASEP